MKKRVYKTEDKKMFAGVCSGLAEYFEVDPSIVRILMVFLWIVKGIGLLLYVVLALILPTKSEIEKQDKIIDGVSSNFYQ